MGAPSTPADKCQARPLRMELQLQRRFRRPSGRRVRSTNFFLCHARVSLHEWHGINDLNTRLDPLSGWILSDAADINEAGQITGQGLINGQYHAYLLTPIPFAGDYNSNGTSTQPTTFFGARTTIPRSRYPTTRRPAPVRPITRCGGPASAN